MPHGGSRANSRRREVRLDGHQQREEAGVRSLQIKVPLHHLLQGRLEFLQRSMVSAFEAIADVLYSGNNTVYIFDILS